MSAFKTSGSGLVCRIAERHRAADGGAAAVARVERFVNVGYAHNGRIQPLSRQLNACLARERRTLARRTMRTRTAMDLRAAE